MKPVCSLLAIVTLLSLFTFGCSDDPGTVGLGVLPPQDSLHVHSFLISAKSDTTFLSRIVGGGATLLVGKFQSLQAASLLSFSGISVIPAGAELDSVTLSLKINYRFKDSSGTLG